MASMRDIKRRKSSITSTQQITKAMKLVSTVKLQKARAHAEATDPYFNYMYRTVSSMLAKSGNLEHPYLKAGDSPRKAVVVLTSNRGLAGGYNSNIVKLITHGDFKKEELDIYAVGAKGEELLTSKGYHIVESASEMMEDPTYEDAAALCKRVLKAFTDGQVGEIYLAYTHFKNTVTQEAKLIKLLPVELDGDTVDKRFMDEVVKMLALDGKLNSMPNNLSGGQQQRVAIARALVSKPAIILADEPTGNLDSRTSSDVLGLLKVTSQKFHQTLVMITHNNEIAQLADRIIRIEDGKIAQ